MTELSPQAQAVLDAWDAKLDPMVTCLTHDPEREALAAALRAVADQVVPENYDPPRSCYPEAQAFVDGKCCRNEDVRAELLTIATELQNQ